MKNYKFCEIKVGAEDKFITIIKNSQINTFSEISGDKNIIHLDKKKAKKKKFKDRVVHGAFIFSLFSKLIGTKIPGNNALILNINLKFHNPAYPNKEIYIIGTVKEKYNSVSSILLDLVAKYKNGKLIASGNTIIKLL